MEVEGRSSYVIKYKMVIITLTSDPEV